MAEQESLESIMEAVLAVAGGARSAPAIAQAIGIAERQSVFRRDAAVELGLLALDSSGEAQVSERAVRVLSARDAVQRKARLRHALRQVQPVQHLLTYLQQYPLGCTVKKLGDIVDPRWQLGDLDTERRAQLLVGWLKEVELVSEARGVVRAVDGLAQR